MADDKITGQDLVDDSAFERLKKLDSILEGILQRFTQIEKAAQNAFSSNQLSEASKGVAKATNEANEALKEQERLERALLRQKIRNENAQSEINKELIKQRLETQAQTQAIRRNVTATNEFVGAYRRLSAQLNIAKGRLKDIIVEQGRFSTAAVRQQREVDKLATKIREADRASGDFQRNVGNYPTQITPVLNLFKQLVGAFGALEGFRLGVRFLRDSVDIAREAKGIEFAFDNLGEAGQEAFDKIKESTRGLLSDLDIKQATVDFDTFRLSVEDLDTVLEFVALRATQTGRSFEFLRSSAIEAISKESVRRADNLGLSQKNLNDRIKEGATFLEAFTQIAQEEIDRAGGVLDEAANSAQKFDAELNDLQVSLGKLLTSFKGLSLFITPMQRLSFQFEQINFFIQEETRLLDKITAIVNTATLTGQAYNQSLINEAMARKEVEEAIQAQIDAYIRLNGTLGPLSQDQKEVTEDFSLYLDEQERGARTVKAINDEIKAQKDLLLEATTRAEARAIQDKIKALEKEREAILGVTKAQKKKNEEQRIAIELLAETATRSLQNTISVLKEQQTEVAIGGAEWRQYAEEIAAVEEQLRSLTDIASGDLSGIEFIDEDELAVFQDVQNFLNTEGINAGLQDLANKLGVTQAELIDEFESLYEKDFENFKKYVDLKILQDEILKEQRLANLQSTINAAATFTDAVLELQSQRAEEELQKQNDQFDAIINSKTASEEQIALAEKKRRENEIKIEKEREKSQRRAFLIQQAVEISRILIQRATASAAALAPPPIGLGPVLGATLLPGININAALAIATILAQSIPAFFKGKTAMDSYSGKATVNELPGQREVGIDEHGNVELFRPGMHVRDVRSKDIIIPSIPQFIKELGDQNTMTYRRISRNFRNSTHERIQSQLSGFSYSEALMIAQTLDKGLTKGFSRRQPIHIHPTIKIGKRKYSA